MKRALATVGAIAALAFAGAGSGLLLSSASSSPIDDKTTFCTSFAPAERATWQPGKVLAKWASQNPGERASWDAFADAICAGKSPGSPTLATAHGRALVAAGEMALPEPPAPTTSTSTTTATSTTTTTTTTTTQPAPSGAYWIGDMTTFSAFDTHEAWQNERVNDPYFGQNVSPMVLQPDAIVGRTARVIAANKRADGSMFPSGSSSGTTINLWEPGAYQAAWWQRGRTTWCRVRILIPDGTDPRYPGELTPVPGDGVDNDFHVLAEWHKNDSAGAPGPTSTKLETAVFNGKPALIFKPIGGLSGQIKGKYLYETDQVQTTANGAGGTTGPIGGNVIALKFNHWYDLLWRWKLDPDPAVGEIDWYVDGSLRVSGKFGNMFQRSDGSVPGLSFQAGMYRSYPFYGGRATDTTDANEHVYVGPMYVGPTRASVGG